MLEIPEAKVISDQINNTLLGKQIKSVVADQSHHKLAFYFGEPSLYNALLSGRTIESANPYGGRIEIEVEGAVMQFGDGANLHFYREGEILPEKHQLLVTFTDRCSLVCTVAMYGGIWCSKKGEMTDMYSTVAKEKPSPFSNEFNYDYFLQLLDDHSLKLSAKAFLATEQRIPGLGNGVLQDILLNAKIHPKKKMNTTSEEQRHNIFQSIKTTLEEMVLAGGRDTERDLFGNPGGYVTKLSKKTVLSPCRNCGGVLKKEAYLGGSIYYCQECQVK